MIVQLLWQQQHAEGNKQCQSAAYAQGYCHGWACSARSWNMNAYDTANDNQYNHCWRSIGDCRRARLVSSTMQCYPKRPNQLAITAVDNWNRWTSSYSQVNAQRGTAVSSVVRMLMDLDDPCINNTTSKSHTHELMCWSKSVATCRASS